MGIYLNQTNEITNLGLVFFCLERVESAMLFVLGKSSALSPPLWQCWLLFLKQACFVSQHANLPTVPSHAPVQTHALAGGLERSVQELERSDATVRHSGPPARLARLPTPYHCSPGRGAPFSGSTALLCSDRRNLPCTLNGDRDHSVTSGRNTMRFDRMC